MRRKTIRRLPCLLVLTAASPVQAIIRFADGTPTSHTTAPASASDPNMAADVAAGFSNSGWQYVGYFPDKGDGTALPGIPIGPHSFITAQHIDNSVENPGVGSTFIYNGVTYTIPPTSVHEVAGRDLAVVTISGTFPTWAPLYNETTDGALTSGGGKTTMLVSRGTQRGNAITVSMNRGGTEGTTRGWAWGTDDRVQRWGTNLVSGYTEDDSLNTQEYFTFDFNRVSSLPDEGVPSNNDSGGGVFVKGADGVWKLAGVISGALADYKVNSGDPAGLRGAIFDYRELFYEGTDNAYHNFDSSFPGAGETPGYGYASNISDATPQLNQFLPLNADANLDGRVNALDFNAIAANYGLTSGAVWAQGDFNHDGKITTQDFSILAANYGATGAALPGAALGALAPEPGTLLMGTCACATLLSRRRRRIV